MELGCNAGGVSSARAVLGMLSSSSNSLKVAAWHWHHHALAQTQTKGLSHVVGPAYPRPPHCSYSGTAVPVGTGAVTVVKDVVVDDGMVIVVVVKVRVVEVAPTVVLVKPGEGDGVMVVVVQLVIVESGAVAAMLDRKPMKSASRLRNVIINFIMGVPE